MRLLSTFARGAFALPVDLAHKQSGDTATPAPDRKHAARSENYRG
jgi:hypothetical protein